MHGGGSPKQQALHGVIEAVNDNSSEISEESAIPDFGAPKAYGLPESCGDGIR